ncbi:MAG: hypothetical protein PVG71_15390, partial [Anaerolineae bacterium]
TAAVIDQLLRALQQLGLGDYDPEIPLDRAVAQAGAGLEPGRDRIALPAPGGGAAQPGTRGVRTDQSVVCQWQGWLH